jgi:[ribosomal protein S5]-alanine N-acetyltransferase
MKKVIILRPIKFKDHIWIHKYFNNYEIVQHLSENVKYPYSRVQSMQYMLENISLVKNKERYIFIICLAENNQPIGRIDYIVKSSLMFSRGFWLAKDHWNNGYMTEACKKADKWIFNNTSCQEIHITNSVQNVASRRVKEKLGYQHRGIVDGVKSLNGETQSDSWILTKERWQLNIQSNI